MDDASRCEVCGGPLGQEQELGLSCPRCLLLLAMPGENVGRYGAGSRLEPGTTIGRYRIVRLIGDGGMGTVYEAEQELPRRTVALKLIKPEFTNLELLRRFEQESLALGRLQHPGIAQIYEAGTADTGHGPQPYLAMEFIHGQSLREYADQHHLSARDRLALVAQVCDAVHHAHQRGLIHRDLKPANILVDEAGQPKVLDFGVARVTDGDVQTTLYTGIGQLVGTLAYMSPEQVFDDPLELDTRSDVYALGVICYELLANRMPYSIGKTVLEAAQTIREEDPARLSSFNRSYRGDIETIAARALEKDKTRRYSSAAELAADIRRYLNDEPIVARPPSARYQLQKFARRNKALVTGIAAVLVVAVAGATTAIYQAALIRRDRDTLAWQALARESVRLSGNRDNDELALLLARQAFLIHSRTPDQPRYLVEDALQQATGLSPVGRVISGHRSWVTSAAFSLDLKLFASCSSDGTVRVLDLNKPNAPPLIFAINDAVRSLAISPDGTLLAAASLQPQIWNLREPTAPPRAGWQGSLVNSVAFSPDGKRLATGSSTGVSIWALPYLGLAPLGFDSNSDILSLAFSPDGSRLATTGDQIGVRVWDARNPGTAPLMQLDPGSSFHSVVFSSDSSRVAAREFSSEVRVWDLRVPNPSGRSLGHTPPSPALTPPGSALGYGVVSVNSVAFSPDGKQLASAGEDGIVSVWNLDQPGAEPALSLRGPRGTVYAVAFSPDGARLASGGEDIRIWSLREPGGPLRHSRAHQGAVVSLAFSPNNAYIASGGLGSDRTARLWDARGSKQEPVTLQHEDSVLSLEFSQDSQLLASATKGFVRVWTILRSETPPRLFPGAALSQFFGSVALGFSPDGTMLTALFWDDGVPTGLFGDRENFRPRPASVKRWDLRTAQSQTILELTGTQAFALSNHGSRVASPQADGSIQVSDLRRPTRPELSLAGDNRTSFPGIVASAFSRRGDLVASIGLDRNVRIWKLENPNAPPLTFQGPDFFWGNFVAFTSEDTRLLAAGVEGDGVHMFDLREPGARPLLFKGSKARISSTAVSQDGAYLALGDVEGNIWVWALWEAAANQLCDRVTRNLSMEEWQFYVGQSIPYESTCPALPAGTGAR